MRHNSCKKHLPVNRFLFILVFAFVAIAGRAQKVDSIFFHLYTDSLKKGTHNYINVDGKFSDGRWQPMTAKDVKLTSTSCSFSGNDLVIPADCPEEKITVRAELKSNPAMWIERTIWVKKIPDPEILPTRDEIMRGMQRKRR